MANAFKLTCVGVLGLFLISSPTLAQKSQNEVAEEVRKEQHKIVKQFYRQHAQSIDFKLDEKGIKRLKLEEPVFTYIGQDYDHFGTVAPLSGDVYVWTYEGRAVVVGGVLSFPYTAGRRVYQEFQSLIETPPQPIRSPSQVGANWSPSGIKLRPIPGEPRVPSRNSRLRLIQMRQISREFTADTKSSKDGSVQPLKLKASPVYRLNAEELRKAKSSVVDGALFLFTNQLGDDPEMCLLIECHQDKNGLTWKYTPGSLAFQGLWLRHKKSVVWRTGQWPGDPGDGNFVSSQVHRSITMDAIRESVSLD